MGERKSCKKVGRNANSPSRKRYWANRTLQHRREARIKRHILAHPNDHSAPPALARIENEPIKHLLKPDSYLPGTPNAGKRK